MAFTTFRGYKLRANYREHGFVGVKNKWFMDVIGKAFARHGKPSFLEDAQARQNNRWSLVRGKMKIIYYYFLEPTRTMQYNAV